MTINVGELHQQLLATQIYSAEPEAEILRVRNEESGSEYVLESFGESIQIRQAVWFDCNELNGNDLGNIYRLCSMMNGRLSGCKSYVDQWGALLTTSDIVEPGDGRFVISMLDQVEFMSLAMLALVRSTLADHRLPTEDEIDTALEVPALQ